LAKKEKSNRSLPSPLPKCLQFVNKPGKYLPRTG
jgi:hypothetical protein